jgi:superfamily II DNA or RNA helicase
VKNVLNSQLVRVRGARWQIVDLRQYDGCQLVTVMALDPLSNGACRRFLTPFDVVEALARPARSHKVGVRQWRRACRRLIADNVTPGGLRSAPGARIDLLPYQLEPALAILRGTGTRVLLADAVGLGKTIQAGLIAAELEIRRCAERILVLAPPGLRGQWALELRQRFGLDFSLADAPALRRLAAELPPGTNPWATIPLAIASVDYVKRPEVLPAIRSCRWDLVVVDEAHGAVGDSDRHEAVRILTARAPYVVLVTATPHSGNERTFESLCELGRVDVRNVERLHDPLIVFRRPRTIMAGAPARRIHMLRIRSSAAEGRMHAALARYTEAVQAEHGDRCLAMAVLHKRAFSGPWALAESISRRLAAISPDAACGEQLSLPLGDPDGECTNDDQPPAWPVDLALADENREYRLLSEVLDAACRADGSDSKVRILTKLVGRVRESIIVFTEYRDTLRRLRAAIGRPAVLLHGGLGAADRELALEEFCRQPGTVLLATDAAGQGLNLHHHCRIVVSLELPWNPLRLEQRIGRVDRIGQKRRVHAIHFVGANTNEVRILARLRARLARASAEIGAPDPLGGRLGAEDERSNAWVALGGRRGVATTRTDTPVRGAASCEPATLAGVSASSPQRVMDPGNCIMPVLGGEARREVERLMVARRHADQRRTTGADGQAPLVARVRRQRMRQMLKGRKLQIWRVAAVDGTGRIAESYLIASLVAPALTPDQVRPSMEEAARPWCQAVTEIASEFWAVRLNREHDIVTQAAAPSCGMFQPGLFDRRAERAHRERQAFEAERAAEAATRLTALRLKSRLDFQTPELLLTLVP